MEVKKLYEMVDEDQKEGSLGEKAYWKDLWECYIEEKSMDYASLSVKEAIPRLVSEQNLRERRHAGSCGELGVDIRVGDICYIDFGEAFVVPMSGNHTAYLQAYSKENPKGKRHLMRLGKIKGMNKESVLFINDAKWINTARIIDVKAHLRRDSELFREIKDRVKNCLD